MFTKEELDVIYTQVGARKTDFETMLIKAATQNDVKRIIEIADYIKLLQSIMTKALDNKSHTTPIKKRSSVNEDHEFGNSSSGVDRIL